ncbi:hypothetical protein KSP40_PGU001292 [Platanthera guangdongensis]|uniref:Uncharacterized protein n=1 Tax=Platanthera guangdongensis TaxID=2320717 RepID=A0ABR2MN19_9ASPA
MDEFPVPAWGIRCSRGSSVTSVTHCRPIAPTTVLWLIYAGTRCRQFDTTMEAAWWALGKVLDGKYRVRGIFRPGFPDGTGTNIKHCHFWREGVKELSANIGAYLAILFVLYLFYSMNMISNFISFGRDKFDKKTRRPGLIREIISTVGSTKTMFLLLAACPLSIGTESMSMRVERWAHSREQCVGNIMERVA